MKVTLSQKEIGDAIIGYLKQRGIDTDLSKIYMHVEISGGQRIYSAEIREVEIAPKEGPYR